MSCCPDGPVPVDGSTLDGGEAVVGDQDALDIALTLQQGTEGAQVALGGGIDVLVGDNRHPFLCGLRFATDSTVQA